ncbi:MAG: hypothetical protein JWM80_6155 [Cyanobacteria bacterium RYN_339]|nr:hypothetical protein [Cyanobacteria bacterium RYN_339]
MGASHYEVLGVPRDVDAETLKQAYREAAKRLHPDAGAQNGAAMVRLNAAYDVLRDPAKRKRYDAENPASRKPPVDIPYVTRVFAPTDATLRAALGAIDAAAAALSEDVDDDDFVGRLDDALDAGDVALRGARWDLAAAPCPRPLAARLRAYVRALGEVEEVVEGLRSAAGDAAHLLREQRRLDQVVRALAAAGAALRG